MESQSRYGIMEELNTKKLSAKQEIANLEEQKETGERDRQNQINSMKNQVAASEQTYKMAHLQWKAQQESAIRLEDIRHKTEIDTIQDEIKKRDENLEPNFKAWKANQLERIKAQEQELKEFSGKQNRLIATKKEILKELDSGMKNLKEMSKEQKEK